VIHVLSSVLQNNLLEAAAVAQRRSLPTIDQIQLSQVNPRDAITDDQAASVSRWVWFGLSRV